MSHITRIKTQILEKEYLLRALDDLGYRYEEGDLEINSVGKTRAKVEIKVLMRMSFDIGFKKGAQGYEIITDWWGVRGTNQKDFTARLQQRYAYHLTRARLEAQGFALVEEQAKDGQIHLTLRRMA
jgi:hypothetical protein